jgi:hypothetical protein
MEVSIMVAVREFSWEEVSSPDFGNPARQAWREAVAEIADKAKATLPQCNGRVEKAVAIVLNGDVTLLEDGKARVASQSNGTTAYFVVNGTCECRDFAKAPSGWCKHRIAAGMAKRATPLAKAKLDAGTNGQPPPAEPQASPVVPSSPLPEAPASVNVRLELGGREVQLTLRDSHENRLLARLEAVLQRFPLAAKPVDDTPHCPKHGVPMKLNHGKDGSTWYSHKTADGQWCKGR